MRTDDFWNVVKYWCIVHYFSRWKCIIPRVLDVLMADKICSDYHANIGKIKSNAVKIWSFFWSKQFNAIYGRDIPVAMPVILVTESLSNRNEIYIIYNKFRAKCFTGNELLKYLASSREAHQNNFYSPISPVPYSKVQWRSARKILVFNLVHISTIESMSMGVGANKDVYCLSTYLFCLFYNVS